MTAYLEDLRVLIKIRLHIPLPMKNHFYKWHRFSTQNNWFCTGCDTVFHLKNKGKNAPASDAPVCCPSCGSRSVVWYTFLYMAIIEEKPKEYLHWLLKLSPEKIIAWMEKNRRS